MVEIKFTAQKTNGQTITGTLTADSSGEAKRKITSLAEKNNLKILSTEKKSTFLYRAARGKEKPIRGEQKAFNKKEVEEALTRLGYSKFTVNKKLLDFESKPPVQEIVTFVKISAELLDQKLAYGEVLTLLINDTQNAALRNTLRDINNDLKKGADSQATFLKYQNVFGKFTAYMLGLSIKVG